MSASLIEKAPRLHFQQQNPTNTQAASKPAIPASLLFTYLISGFSVFSVAYNRTYNDLNIQGSS
jgi:hypothetical protein